MKILALGAHPDDIDIFMFGLVSIYKKEGGTSFLNSINIDPNIRPENLTLEEFCKLEFNLRKS